MKKKLIIGAGVLLTIFVIFLIAICGGASSNNTVTEDELKQTITSVTCEVANENNVDYGIDILSNDISFDSVLKSKDYTKITINKEKDFKSLGVAFIARSNEQFSVNATLYKNDEVLKTTTITFEDTKMKSVKLLLENSVEVKTTDNFYIKFEQDGNCEFAFDTLIFFFDEA